MNTLCGTVHILKYTLAHTHTHAMVLTALVKGDRLMEKAACCKASQNDNRQMQLYSLDQVSPLTCIYTVFAPRINEQNAYDLIVYVHLRHCDVRPPRRVPRVIQYSHFST